MKKILTNLLLLLVMGTSGAWATQVPYNVGESTSSSWRDAESTAYTLTGDGCVTYTFTNYVDATNTDISTWGQNWQLLCTKTSETKSDADNSNRYFIVRADRWDPVQYAAGYDGWRNFTVSDNFWTDFKTWNNEATVNITITREGNTIFVNAVSKKSDTTYNMTYTYTLDDATATTKFFLVNGDKNYLTVTAEAQSLYTRTLTSWTSNDKTSWGNNANLTIDGTNGFGFNTTQPSSAYSATKTFNVTNNAKVTYNVSWYTGNSTGRNSNYEYIQFGDKVRLSYNYTSDKKYKYWINTDGTSSETTEIGEYKGLRTNTISIVFDTSTKKVESFTFNGTDLSSYVTGTLAGNFNSVTFGLQRGGSTSNWSYPNFLTSINVTEQQQEVATADYTVKYVCNGEEVKDAVIRNGNVGNAITLEDADKANFFNADKTKKYIYDRDDAASQTIVAGGTAVATVTFREASKYSYTVKSSIGNEFASGSDFEGESVSYAYPRYLNNEGTLYGATKQSSDPNWGSSFTLTEDNQEVTVAYTATETKDVKYFTETEDITGATTLTGGNANIRCSNKKCGYYQGTLVNLPAGKYKLTTSVWGNDGTTITFKAGDNTILEATTVGYIKDYTSDEFTLTEATDITISGGANSNNYPKATDFIYIVKTGNYFTPGEDVTSYGSNLDFSGTDVSAWSRTATSTGNLGRMDANPTVLTLDAPFLESYINIDDVASNTNQTLAQQTISGMLKGYYKITAYTFNRHQNFGDSGVEALPIYLFIGDGQTEVNSATFTQYSVIGKITEDGDLTFGIKSGENFNTDWNGIANITLTYLGTEVEKTSTEDLKGYKTFYNASVSYKVDPEKVQIYKAEAVTSLTPTTITMDYVESNGIIPAGTPVMLRSLNGNTETMILTPTTESAPTDAYKDNAFKAAETAGSVANAYVLGYLDPTKVEEGQESGLGFYKYEASLEAGQVYVQAASGAKLSIKFNDPTAINNVNASTSSAQAQAEGKYIKNGKLVIVKNGKQYTAAGAQVK